MPAHTQPPPRARDFPLPVVARSLLFVLLWLSADRPACAQTGGPYDLGWNTLDAGGVTPAIGGSYRLDGTVAQPDAGPLSGGAYTLTGGFWGGAQGGPVGVDDPPQGGPIATAFRLLPVAPNPFSATTTIAFELPSAQHVTVVLFDVSGQRVRVLLDERRGAGRQSVTWDGTDAAGRGLGTGIYWARASAMGRHLTQRVALLR